MEKDSCTNVITHSYKLVETRPSIFNLIPTKLRKKTLHEFIRWIIQYPFGYKVFTIESEGVEIAYLFCSNGMNPRYPFASKKDIILGPDYVDEKFRNQGIASDMLNQVILSNCLHFEKIYAFIDHDNKASIRTVEKIGFKYLCDVKYNKLRILKKCTRDIGDEKLFVFEKN